MIGDKTVKRPRGGEIWQAREAPGKSGDRRCYVYVNHRRDGYVTYTYFAYAHAGGCLAEYDFVDAYQFVEGVYA